MHRKFKFRFKSEGGEKQYWTYVEKMLEVTETVKLPLCLTEDVWESGNITPCVPNFGTRWR